MNTQKALGQYFTPEGIANRVVAELREPVGKVLELGTGNGALANALLELYPLSTYLGVEIDPAMRDLGQERLRNHRVFLSDVLNHQELSLIKELSSADAVIGNPPFIQTYASTEILGLLRDTLPSVLEKKTSKIAAELVFLAESLVRLKKGGQASFILPLKFFVSPRYQGFRKDLVTQFSDISVTQIPGKAFDKAEVDACILRFNKKREKKKTINIASSNLAGVITDSIQVNKATATVRMDYAFNRLLQDGFYQGVKRADTLSSIGVDLSRGSATRSALERSKLPYFHTTSFPKEGNSVSLDYFEVNEFRHAEEGDIFVPRVGSRCLDRQAVVESGRQVYTDCIYKLRADEAQIDRIMKTLTSDFGKAWRLTNAGGSCAKFVTKSALLGMPLLD